MRHLLRRARRVLTATSVVAITLAVPMVAGGTPASAAAGTTLSKPAVHAAATPLVSASDVANLARAQVGNGCRPYTTAGGASACDNYWCAVFASWVWRNAGVPEAPDTWVATDTAVWAQQHGLWKPRPANGEGDPQPGDMVVYGAPGAGTGGHVGIVYSVNSNGTITTVDGDYGGTSYTNSKVDLDTVNPVTATSGGKNWPISGYIQVPGLTPPYVPQPGDFVNTGVDDVSGDGFADLVLTSGSEVTWLPNGSKVNAGGVPFVGNASHLASIENGDMVATASIAGSGYADMFIYSPSSGYLYYLPNSGQGGYNGNAVFVADLGTGVQKIAAADMTGDGHADLVYEGPDNNLYMLPNNMDSTSDHLPFTGEVKTQIASMAPGDIWAVGNISDDHFADLAFIRNGTLYDLLNNSLSNPDHLPFTGEAGSEVRSGFDDTTQLSLPSLTGDGFGDLEISNAAGDVSEVYNNWNVNGGIPFQGDVIGIATVGNATLS